MNNPIKNFKKEIKRVFKFLFKDYGFKIVETSDNLIIAKKGEVQVEFRYSREAFSVGIRLTGKLGKKATQNERYRNLGVSAIAMCSDPDLKVKFKFIKTHEEMMDRMEEMAEYTKKYCLEILQGDVSKWQDIVDCIQSEEYRRRIRGIS